MEPPAMNGLASLLANAGTLHSLAEPPSREDFSTAEAYDVAHREWQAKQHWQAYVR